VLSHFRFIAEPAQFAGQREVSGPECRKDLARFGIRPQCRAMLAFRRLHTAEPVPRLSTFRVPVEDAVVMRARVIPFRQCREAVRQTQLCNQIVRANPQRDLKRFCSGIELAPRHLDRAQEVDPVEIPRFQKVRARVYGRGCVVLPVGVQRHGQHTGGFRVARVRLGRSRRLLNLASNHRQKTSGVDQRPIGNAGTVKRACQETREPNIQPHIRRCCYPCCCPCC
jgi:hypothetical protein